MNNYVLGFAFIGNLVVLIKKNRPVWQKGFLNGVGGKIESSDFDVYGAMVREFLEETGVTTKPKQWKEYAVLKGKDFRIAVLYTDLPKGTVVETMTDEEVIQYDLESTNIQHCSYELDNVPYLISLAMSKDVRENKIKLPLKIKYTH